MQNHAVNLHAHISEDVTVVSVLRYGLIGDTSVCKYNATNYANCCVKFEVQSLWRILEYFISRKKSNIAFHDKILIVDGEPVTLEKGTDGFLSV